MTIIADSYTSTEGINCLGSAPRTWQSANLYFTFLNPQTKERSGRVHTV